MSNQTNAEVEQLHIYAIINGKPCVLPVVTEMLPHLLHLLPAMQDADRLQVVVLQGPVGKMVEQTMENVVELAKQKHSEGKPRSMLSKIVDTPQARL